jgi:hypothetical protein
MDHREIEYEDNWIDQPYSRIQWQFLYKVLFRNPQGRKPLKRHRHKYDDNIKIYLREIGCGDVSWRSWNSSFGIVTGYRLDNQLIGVQFLEGAGNFSLLHYVQTGSGTHQPPI